METPNNAAFVALPAVTASGSNARVQGRSTKSLHCAQIKVSSEGNKPQHSEKTFTLFQRNSRKFSQKSSEFFESNSARGFVDVQSFTLRALPSSQAAVSLDASTLTVATLETPVAPPPRRVPRFIQHKKEAYWFYRFLSLVYDDFINPLHWTEDMRDRSLTIAQLEGLRDRNPVVVDVGAGTGFTTQGILKYINAENVTMLDQSPHQLAQAKKKPELSKCNMIEGDAEDLPFETDSCDRYVSAGSIEYWPEPQRGIAEAYRVLKPGGVATLIGPVLPTHPVSRWFANAWMLFPTEEEYRDWYTKAGFTDIQVIYVTPKAYRGIREHGLIMGLSISGVKPRKGDPLIPLGSKLETRVGEVSKESLLDSIIFPLRFIFGTIAGIYYAVLPLFIMAWAALFVKEPVELD